MEDTDELGWRRAMRRSRQRGATARVCGSSLMEHDEFEWCASYPSALSLRLGK